MQQRTTSTQWAWGVVAVGAGLAIVQGVVALFDPPGDSFTGSRADYVADGLWAGALAFTLIGYWELSRARTDRLWRVAAYAGIVGQALLAVAVLATLTAGREVLDMVFIAGFGVAAVSVLTLAILGRSAVLGLLVPAFVLSLAFFGQGGAAAFGAVWGFVSFRRGI